MKIPPVYLPPDLVSEVQLYNAPDNLWHIPKDLFNKIWKNVTGKNIKVAILDTGCSSHPDLPTPLATKSFISGESATDGNGHGTHCAGTVLGRNGIGLAPDADLIVCKVLSNGGSGSSDAIANGIRWAVSAGADIISMSLGSSSPYKPMEESIKYAWDNGCLVTAAAGNSGFTGRANTIGYPAKYPNCLCIGAYRSDGQRASFSSGGRELDIVCPGQAIISASHRGGYVGMSGTSMATPFSAGLLALIVQSIRQEGYPSFTGIDAIRTFFQENTEDKGDPGQDPFWGYGIPKTEQIINKLANQELVFV